MLTVPLARPKDVAHLVALCNNGPTGKPAVIDYTTSSARDERTAAIGQKRTVRT